MLSVHVHRTQPVAVPSFAVRGLTFLVFFFLSWRDNWNLGGRKCELIYRIHRKYTIISRIIFSIWQLYLACLNRHESNPSIPILPKSNQQHLWLYFWGVLKFKWSMAGCEIWCILHRRWEPQSPCSQCQHLAKAPRLASCLLQQFLSPTGALGDSLSVCVAIPKLSRSVSRGF